MKHVAKKYSWLVYVLILFTSGSSCSFSANNFGAILPRFSASEDILSNTSTTGMTSSFFNPVNPQQLQLQQQQQEGVNYLYENEISEILKSFAFEPTDSAILEQLNAHSQVFPKSFTFHLLSQGEFRLMNWPVYKTMTNLSDENVLEALNSLFTYKFSPRRLVELFKINKEILLIEPDAPFPRQVFTVFKRNSLNLFESVNRQLTAATNPNLFSLFEKIFNYANEAGIPVDEDFLKFTAGVVRNCPEYFCSLEGKVQLKIVLHLIYWDDSDSLALALERIPQIILAPVNQGGKTLLHFASKWTSTECLRFLLSLVHERALDASEDASAICPFAYAIQLQSEPVLEVFDAFGFTGSTVFTVNSTQMTAKDYAAQMDYLGCFLLAITPVKFMLPIRAIARTFSSQTFRETRLNPLNIQILSKSLAEKVFPSPGNSSLSRLQMQTLELTRKHLESHAIPWEKDRQFLPEISGKILPKLLATEQDGDGGELKEHFARMAVELGDEYFKLAWEFGKRISEGGDKGKIPGLEDMKELCSMEFESGKWFKWTGKDWQEAPEGPTDKVIVFDVETCPQISQFPILACAYGPSGWYIWRKPEEKDDSGDLDQLIPLKHPILVIGHHVAFDRARIRDEYVSLERRDCRFLDTLSMHCAVAGLSSQQRGLWQERKKRNETEAETETEEVEIDSSNEANDHSLTEKWGSRCSLNNLSDALQLHCNRKLNKSVRDDLLLKSTCPQEISAALPEIMEYCARDVEATAHLFSVLLPKFLKKSPHPVTFTALLEMGSFVLPVQKDNWTQYMDTCDGMLQEATKQIELELKKLVDETAENGLSDNDPWLSQLDWTVEPIRYTKARYLKDGVTYAKGGEPKVIGNSPWMGKPAWFKKLVKGGEVHVTARTSIVPLLLKLKWKGQVVHLIPENGWCFEVVEGPGNGTKDANNGAAIIPFAGKQFQRIPHPGGRDENVGCLLTKNFLKYFQSGDLSTENKLIERLLEVNSKFSFWTGYRERVREQFVIDNKYLGTGIILPTVQPMGTVTRRAVEKTWLTASNAKEKLVGSELKALVKAPDGWCFVGADVDSQELWIGSLLGDAQFGWSGSTALGWMTLQGTKSDGTDLHSRTANILGMTRDNAKIFNYGRIYGAGVKYAAQLLLKFNPNLSPAEAAQKASDLYHATKGKRISNRRDVFASYAGGTESFMFNQMEAIARAKLSKTPVLSAEISDALISEHVDDNFITSRVNWVVQSSGVDYLHLLLVASAFLFRQFKIPGRVALTIHDEVRFLVPEAEKYRAALALQIANLWTRAVFVQAVGVQDLPLSVAFFSAVDIDKVLRKEVFLPCVTPSNPNPIPPGQSLDIYKLLEKCDSLGPEQDNAALSDKISSKFMYKFYAAKNEQAFDGNRAKVLTVEEEQKYLALLRKQMKKDSSYKGNPKVTDNKNVHKEDEDVTPKNKVNPNNEIFNRWNKLINKHNQTK